MADDGSDEVDEQIGLDGENDEDLMDDEEPMEDYNYRDGDEYGEEEHGYEGEEHENISIADEAEDASCPKKEDEGARVEEELDGAKDDEEIKKHNELLALPPHGSEVFIGGLPRDVTEEDLRALCEPFGEIFEVRLMKDKDRGESKGFAFITFTTNDAAQKAIEEVHDKEFKGRTLRCSLSQAKHRLFIGNVPKSFSEEEIRKILEDIGPGVENLEYFKDLQNPNRNRGFIFVEYYNHACAEYARQKMSSANFKIDGSTPTVSWAEPKNAADASAAAQVKCVYVKNLPENVTSEKLKEIFGRHGEVTKVVLPPAKAGQNKRDFGFIHFAERSSALRAVKGTEKYEIDGHVLEAVLAKPQTERKSDSHKAGLFPSYPPYPSYGYPPDPYGAYGSGYGASGYGHQPVIYGRGPTPAGMKMVPMVLPDGRLGYVLQQPGTQVPPPPPPRRTDRHGGSNDGEDRGSEGSRGRRYRPY
ncbi:hypothetical protein J5N97_025559 [Dioscorea zingiberensis]|uniref:RRM domain-containing protein n=1 Tax=Dioscorea zingiberensis TaxID=325984 RepID=A0A9D5H9Y5_9LILI|nr:hypothetical protein J5N97_025559 [Dioscorea zingiberensis]